jgi:hypothetical protein
MVIHAENTKVGNIYPLLSSGQCSDRNIFETIKIVPHPSPATNLPIMTTYIDGAICIIIPPAIENKSAIKMVGFLPIVSDITPEHNEEMIPPSTKKLAKAYKFKGLPI